MPTKPNSDLDQNLEQEIRDLLVSGIVSTDAEVRSALSHDLFFWDNIALPAMVVAPTSADEVAGVLSLAQRFSRTVYVRGGGMSYTNAYGPTQSDSILVDLTKLNRICDVDVINRFIVVETGCTWRDIVEALRPHNMVVDFPAPLSGSHSTVGGAISQNVPGGMQGVLGLEVALADGSLLKTGAWSSTVNDKPFYRNYGPDLTGLFIGDSGVFGVKTAVSLHLKAKPRGVAFGSFAYESYEDMAETMIELAPMDFISRRTGLDPFETANISKVGMGDAIKALSGAVAEEATLGAGHKSAAKLAAGGTNFLDGVKWSLHLKTEGASTRAAEDGLDLARHACLKRGRELPPILPRARDAVGFSIRKFLGKDGERWVATSALWPIGRAVEIATKCQGFFKQRQEKMDALHISHSYITNFSPYYFLCEPCLYWPDELGNLHLDNVSAAEAKKFKTFKANLEARAYVRQIREELRDYFQDLGSVHVQIGGFYQFAGVIQPEALKALSGIKDVFDPKGILNKGKLDGLSGQDTD
jgi:FAD/FMN-containing dehydrogenase